MCDSGDEYEISDPFTIGGVTGAYTIPSPYHTECEWTVISAVALGIFAPPAGITGIGTPTEFNVAAVVGPTTVFSGQGVLVSAVVTATGAANLTFQDGAGNIVGEVLSSATVGQEIIFNNAFNTSLVANNSATTPVVTVTVNVDTPFTNFATFGIGSKNPTQLALSRFNIAQTFGSVASSSPDSNNALPSFVGVLTPAAPFMTFGGVEFMPLANPPFIYLQTATPLNSAVYVTVQFRRKLDRVIPEKPRQKPQTHTHVKDRRAHRTMMEGYAAQYPEEGVAYQHQPPPEQDTGVAKRGVFPLGPLQPTTVSHRGVGGKNGRQR